MVVAHAVPSEVQSTAGSDWSVSPETSGRAGGVAGVHVTPPSSEKNCACWEALIAFEAAMIFLVSTKLTRMSDSLRGVVCAPEIRRSVPTTLLGPKAGGANAASG